MPEYKILLRKTTCSHTVITLTGESPTEICNALNLGDNLELDSIDLSNLEWEEVDSTIEANPYFS